MASERTILFTQLDPTGLGRGVGREGKERNRKEIWKEGESFKERESTLSLDISAIGRSNPGETRGKVDPHRKSYAWVPVLWSFGNSGR